MITGPAAVAADFKGFYREQHAVFEVSDRRTPTTTPAAAPRVEVQLTSGSWHTVTPQIVEANGGLGSLG